MQDNHHRPASFPPARSALRPWDSYDVWLRLVRNNPVCVTDPAGSTGRMDHAGARDFSASVSELPDPVQDALFVIAHARGYEAALAALDTAIREHLATSRKITPIGLPRARQRARQARRELSDAQAKGRAGRGRAAPGGS